MKDDRIRPQSRKTDGLATSSPIFAAIWTIIFCTGLSLLPHSLLVDRRVSSVNQGLQDLRPGQVFHIPSMKGWNFDLEGEKLDLVANDKGWIGGVGLGMASPQILHGWILKPDVRFFIFSTYQLEYFFEELEARNQIEPENPYDLMLSKERWSSLSNSPIATVAPSTNLILADIKYPKDTPITDTCFRKPNNEEITSEFASIRRLPNQLTYAHTGIDLRAKKGSPIFASGSGSIVGVKENPVLGRYILIHHGGSLFSLYAHLLEAQVVVGQEVQAGIQIALSGSSGRVEAPHLHWEMIWRGHYVNPLSVLETWESFCDPA